MSKHALHWVWVVAILLAACSGDALPDFSDKKGPSVISVSPADGATGVSVEAAIVVQFSEAILFRKKLSGGRLEEFDYGGFVVSSASGEAVTGFLQFNNDTITFRGTAPLAHSTKYTVVVSDRIKDLFGNRAIPYEWSFETEPDTVAPFPPYSLTYPPLTNQTPVKLYGAKEAGTTLVANGIELKAAAEATNFEISLPLAEGLNEFSLTTRDEAGNDSTPVKISIRLDTIKPASLTMCASGNGLLWHFEGREACWNPGNPIAWNNLRLPLGATWPSPESDATAVFELGGDIAQFSQNRFTYDGFDPRKYTSTVKLRAYTRDNAGNESLEVFEREFYFDAETTLVLDADNELFQPSGIKEAWTQNSATVLMFEKEAGAAFAAQLDSAMLPATCGETQCSVSIPSLPDGNYIFSAAATDAAGNVARIVKHIHVDQTPPNVVSLPPQGPVIDINKPVTLHIFANEPVVAPELTHAALGAPLQPLLDEGSNGRHWSYQLPTIADGTFSVTVEDGAGNSTQVAWNFSQGSPTLPDSSFTAVTDGTRDGRVTITAAPAPLHVVRWDDGGVSGFAFTTATAITVATNPLSRLKAVLETFDANGDSEKQSLPEIWETAPTLYADLGGLTHEAPIYLRLHPDTGAYPGLTLLTHNGLAHRVTRGGFETYSFTSCAFDGRLDLTFPFVPVEYPYIVLGKPCEASTFANPGVTVVDLSASGLAAPVLQPLWNIPDDDDFGTSLTATTFFGNGSQQFAVGSPERSGKVYLYDSTAASQPLFTLRGDPLATLGGFGKSAAFASKHHRGEATLAIVAVGEPAVYFFENDMYAGLDPLPKYRARVALERMDTCIAAGGRYEVVNAGDMDGDGGDDLVTAAWSDLCQVSPGSRRFPVELRFFFSDRDSTPYTVKTTYERFSPRVAEGRVRLVPLGDINADGLADLGHIDMANGALVRVYYGSRDGAPKARAVAPHLLLNGTAQAISRMDEWVLAGAMDTDNDGRPELILSRVSSGPKLELLALP